VLPDAPNNVLGYVYSAIILTVITFAIVAKVRLKKKDPEVSGLVLYRISVIGILTIFTSTAIFMILIVGQANTHDDKVQSSAETWISQRYEQHFTKPQLDQLVSPLAYPQTDEPNTPVVHYGSTNLVKGGKTTTVQLVKINGQYKVIEVNKQELPTK